jgi:hypothetical protein
MSEYDTGLASLLQLVGLEKELSDARAYQGPLTDCVYYWRRDSLIKIGHSRNLPRRLKALTPGELLAVEPGAYQIEQGRHFQFADYRATTALGTEWFRPGPLLVWHIEAMAKLYPVALLEDLAQLHVPMTTRAKGSVPTLAETAAQRRLAIWAELLPQIVAEAG